MLHNFLHKEYQSDVGKFSVELNTQQNTTNINQVIREESLGTQE